MLLKDQTHTDYFSNTHWIVLSLSFLDIHHPHTDYFSIITKPNYIHYKHTSNTHTHHTNHITDKYFQYKLKTSAPSIIMPRMRNDSSQDTDTSFTKACCKSSHQPCCHSLSLWHRCHMCACEGLQSVLMIALGLGYELVVGSRTCYMFAFIQLAIQVHVRIESLVQGLSRNNNHEYRTTAKFKTYMGSGAEHSV